MSFRTALGLLIITILISLGLQLVVDQEVALEATRLHTRAYFLGLIAIFIATAALGWRSAGSSALRGAVERYFSKARIYLTLIVLVCGVFAATREARGYRVLADEYVLSVEAQQIHREGLSQIPIRTHLIGGLTRSLGATINKRPAFFAFLLSVAHDLFGYDPDNVFRLNFVLTVLFFFLLAGVVDRFYGFSAACAACLLWVSFPLLYQNATGAGFEILNLVMILATVLAGACYWERPTKLRLRFFVLSGLLLANCRYESMLFVVSVGLLILFKWIIDKRSRDVDVVLFLAPVAMAFSVLRLRTFSQNAADNWQVEPGKSPFAVEYLYNNVGHALNYFFPFHRASTGSELLFGLGLALLLFFLLGCSKGLLRSFRNLEIGSEPVLLLVSGTVLVNFGVLLMYHWGQLTSPEVSRLVLPFALICSLAIIYVFYGVGRSLFARKLLLGGAAMFLVLIAIPRGATAAVTKSGAHPARGAWSLGVVKSLPQRNLLVASGDVHLFQLYDFASLPISLLNIRVREAAYHLNLRSFDIIVVQRMIKLEPTGDWTPVSSDSLHPAFETEEIASATFAPFTKTSVLRVRRIDASRLGEVMPEVPAARSKEAQERARLDAGLQQWITNLP